MKLNIFEWILSVLLLQTSTLIVAEDLPATFSYRSVSLNLASTAAWAALNDCKQRGYSVAVTVVDRGGNIQVQLRDRFAGPHTIETAV